MNQLFAWAILIAFMTSVMGLGSLFMWIKRRYEKRKHNTVWTYIIERKNDTKKTAGQQAKV